jgi:hypothetical protein
MLRRLVLCVVLLVPAFLTGCAATTTGKWDKTNQSTEAYQCTVSGDVAAVMGQLTLALMTDNWAIANADKDMGLLTTEPKALTDDETVKQSSMFNAFSSSMVGETYSYDRARLYFYLTSHPAQNGACTDVLMKPVLLYRTTTDATLFKAKTMDEKEESCPQGYPLAQKWIDKLKALPACVE